MKKATKAERAERSRHFNRIWKMAVLPAKTLVLEEADPVFLERCCLREVNLGDWKEQVGKEYWDLREKLKVTCYGKDASDGSLDGRKIAAVFCKALVREKAFVYDVAQAGKLVKEKAADMQPLAFNRWLVRNIYLNYRLAYYASLQLVYLTLLHDLQDLETSKSLYGILDEDTTPLVASLNDIGHLLPYPSPSDADSFDVNVIIGLARADLTRQEFDTFLFALQLYQLEMYTVGKLKTIC